MNFYQVFSRRIIFEKNKIELIKNESKFDSRNEECDVYNKLLKIYPQINKIEEICCTNGKEYQYMLLIDDLFLFCGSIGIVKDIIKGYYKLNYRTFRLEFDFSAYRKSFKKEK